MSHDENLDPKLLRELELCDAIHLIQIRIALQKADGPANLLAAVDRLLDGWAEREEDRMLDDLLDRWLDEDELDPM